MDNGQQVFDNMRNQLIQLREDLDDAVAQLNRADPNDVGATALAVSAAVNQTPECQNLTGTNTTTDTNQPPTGSP